MKLKYKPHSQYVRVTCKQTLESNTVENEREAIEWAAKVSHTFGCPMEFEIVRVVETSAMVWANSDGLALGEAPEGGR